MDTLTAASSALAPNTLGSAALLFLVLAWGAVLSLTGWAYRRLLATPPPEPLPPPGSIP